MNLLLLVFNLLPIYPLDGGQILRSLFWFFLGRARSLMVAAVFGLVVLVAALGWLSGRGLCGTRLSPTSSWPTAGSGLQTARMMLQIAKLPRREGFACPSCHAAPPYGDFWRCPHCGQPFDPFSTEPRCHCTAGIATASCLLCGARHPIGEWAVTPAEATV